MRVYVSGKMSGLPDLGFPAFNKAAASLRASGYQVINPAELDAQDTEQKEWHEYLRRDIEHLVTCDAIALLPNWTDSKGARLEHHIARELGMRVIHLTIDMPVPPTMLHRINSLEEEMTGHWSQELAEINEMAGRDRAGFADTAEWLADMRATVVPAPAPRRSWWRSLWRRAEV